jgi:alpha-mannosidase
MNRVMDAISEGAGVGFGVEGFRMSQVSRGQGIRRLFHVFNPAAWERSGLAEVTLWDWAGSLERMQWQDAAGGPVPHQLVDAKWQDYWGHRYLRLLVQVRVPACGYTTLVLDESQAALALPELPVDMRVERPEELCLENERLLARFDPITCQLVALVDKRSGESLVAAERPAGLRYILEDDRLGMTAWTVGRGQLWFPRRR